MQRLKICVTGSSGMVGYHTVKRLLEKGHEAIALVRTGSDTTKLSALRGVRIVPVDLSEQASIEKAISGCDIFIHAAGIVDPLATRDEIFSVNVQGTRNALAAAESCALKQFIQISSLSVITGQNDQYNVNEEAPLVYCGEAYADSKVEAEKSVMTYFKKGPMLATILRPGFIYGPMERAWMPRLINNLKQRKAMLIDGGKKQCNLIYIENLVTAIELSLLNDKAANQAFNLTDGETITKKQLFDSICDELGFARITKKVPSWLARPVCEIISSIAPSLPVEKRKNLSRFSRAAFRLAGINQGFSINKAEQQLNYVQRIPFAQGMKETLAHFKEKTCQSQSV
ncbi:MAG: NAD(P)-dependent oxidoreductase [Candidatus Obscuribacterales bacterium]|nr:NAD(P)-dependent oxidoreductase [Candidatus Obscuribacterales bacterium]